MPSSNNGYSNLQRFEAVAKQHQHGISQKLAQLQHAIGDGDDSEDEDIENKDAILQQILRNYAGSGDASSALRVLGNAAVGSGTCLICIGSIRRSDAVWNCANCSVSLHLTCTQKWAKDGVIRSSNFLSDELFPDKDKFWACPKCRFEYNVRDAPVRYFCFCGKTVDPKDDPWTLPHSCGETCEKPLKSGCQHKCLLLCHPGPCPPCPAQNLVTCFCGQQKTMVRCGTAKSSCGRNCSKPLSCGKHPCSKVCHDGECPPCPKKVSLQCVCGAEKNSQPCGTKEWHCQRPCGKRYPCGVHSCSQVCHVGDCGSCSRSFPRSCPCGKTLAVADCTAEVLPCDNICGKSVCPQHSCHELCHVGDCGPCLELVKKTCPCGAKTKQAPCSKPFVCDTKCKSHRDCERHPCNKKCCTGRHAACDQPCNRVLNCRTHKCESRCHSGQCYPCTQTIDVVCACGGTVVNVPCGREKSMKPPKCRLLCANPPDCHHSSRTDHYCHFGRCPPCSQMCSKTLPCSHRCTAPCHSAVEVLVRSDKERPSGPWEMKASPELEVREYPCGRCEEVVPVSCLGGHDETPMKCCEQRMVSCGRRCGRRLECGNHTCSLVCHAVERPTDLEQHDPTMCEGCTSLCSHQKACGHPCLLPCHPGACPSCPEVVKVKCYCQSMVLRFSCGKLTSSSGEAKREMLSCKIQCPTLMSCQHPCTKLCHPADEPHSLPAECKKKCAVKCDCGRIKEQQQCCKITKGYKIACDQECQNIAEANKKDAEDKIKKALDEKVQKEQEMQEQYDRKLRGRKRRRERNNLDDEEEGSFLRQHWSKIAGVATFAIVMAFLMHNLLAV
ncbi:hypothetical protein RvY_09730-2 [Ramazzottius varieornatus]|uniref:NF-X1-type domain-containing protein n=1 Tax=Ramazzottius varieornatus TaxID=947166 RepID=A0A1D1VAF1_RAMVA|nr:hypothetical protein RvY_09730-2 [Ramazzottius varieornatus]